MDKKNSKKTELSKPEKKDRGDSLKKVVKRVLDTVEEVKARNPGGDAVKKPVKAEKPKVVVYKKSDDVKLKIIEHTSKENLVKKNEKAEDAVKIERDERKKIRDKYTLKLKNPVAPVVKKDEIPKLNIKVPAVEVKNERPTKKTSEPKSKIEASIDSIHSERHKTDKKKDPHQRKPVIKTVTAKNDSTKVFKAVTFVDQKANPTPLQIKIPNDVKNTKRTAETNTVAKKVKVEVSKDSEKEKAPRRKTHRKRGRRLHPVSPDLSVKVRSPPTEVAKWAPSSINRHTKPYYEAWVSTTLAAISKNSRKDKLFLEKQNVLQSFQRVLAERPETPELFYENFADEKYTGRIKVKHKK